MRLKMIVLGSAVLTATLMVTTMSAQQNPFVGRWNMVGTGPDTDKIYFLEVTQRNDRLAAILLDRSAHATPVASIKVENGELVFQKGAGEGTFDSPVRPCGPIFRAKLEGGKLVGQHTTPGECAPNPNAAARGARAGGEPAPAPKPPAPYTVHWVGTRQPVWPYSNANGFHTYGKPVVLVGPGVGQEAWTGISAGNWQAPCENRWTFSNGTMANAVGAQGERSTCNHYSKEKFKDFRAEAEFLLDAGQNSGFYLRGRYELQLMVGPIGGVTAGRQSLGAIYGWKAADFYAGKPAGEWQTLDAIVVGNRLTAYINDIRIHDNAELPAFTGGALDNDEMAPGPIMIQGDHSRVTFRKLVITPITKAGM